MSLNIILQSKISTFLALSVTVLAVSCEFLGYSRPGDIVELFYNAQMSGENLKKEIFADMKTQMLVERQIAIRERWFGSYESHNRIGLNRNVTIKAEGREETFIYMFEVTCQQGRTRETITIIRERKSEPFHISSYTVEESPPIEVPSAPKHLSA